jgi:hypothetical protein
MKKLIAISITLALVASAAFAQVSVGGQASMAWIPFQGDTRKDSSVLSGFPTWNGNITAKAATENDVFGAVVRVYADGAAHAYAWAWWKPIEQLRFTLGTNPDGIFGTDTFAGWDFNSEANDSVTQGINDNFFKSSAFAGGWSKTGAWLELTPIEGLAVNFAVPALTETDYSAGTWHPLDVTDNNGNTIDGIWVAGEPKTIGFVKAWKDFQALRAQVAYDISGIGKATLTYQGGAFKAPGGFTSIPIGVTTLPVDTGAIYLAFQLSAVENLGLNIGFKYALPVTEENYSGTTDVTFNSPVEIGLGAKYDMGDFGIAGRLNFSFAGNVKPDGGDAIPVPFNFQLNIKPYYDLGILKAFLNLGMDLVTDQENARGDNISDMHMGWYVNPYISKAVGGGTFFAGFQLKGVPANDPDNNKKWKQDIEWGIPVGINLYF